MTRIQRFLSNAALLTLTSLGMRGIGVLFNRYLSVYIGTAGLGQFSLLMSVYGFAVTAASAGLHLAVTRVVSEAGGADDRAAMRCAVRTGMSCAAVFSIGAAGLLYLFAPCIGAKWLGFPEAAPALRLLALSLPLLSLSTTVNGYFVAVRQAYKGAVINLLCQGLRIGITVWGLRTWGIRDGIWPCYALVIASLVSEAACFVLSLLCFLPDYRRRCAASRNDLQHCTAGTARYVLHIALPIALTACIRSGLQTLQHLLIPLGLERSGTTTDAALSAYGTVHGIVLPVLLFPAALLTATAGLLIPEVAELRTCGNSAAVRRNAARILRMTLCYAVFIGGCIGCFSPTLGTLVGGNSDTGRYLTLLAALIPIMYLDTVVDAFLKGLDAQLDSMRYNLLDAAFCVIMAYLLLPPLGIVGYIVLLYASELFNLTLSLGKLLSLTGLHFPFLRWIWTPMLAVMGAGACTGLFFRMIGITYRFPMTQLIVQVLVCAVFYFAFLYLLGAVSSKDMRALRRLVFPITKLPLEKPRKPWYNRKNIQQRGEPHHDKRHPTEP